MTGSKPKTENFSHLLALRQAVLKGLLAWVILSIPAVIFANDIFAILSGYLLQGRPGGQLLATNITSPFIMPLKLALSVSFLVSLPYLFYQIWRFIAPGLYPHERRQMLPLMLFSVGLFLSGMLFAFFIVGPWTLSFFYHIAPSTVQVLTDIHAYVDFIFGLTFAFGFAFQTPLIILLLDRLGICTAEMLATKRRYVIVLAFIVGMILTPPDVVSQVLLALPLMGLFEVGLWLARKRSQ